MDLKPLLSIVTIALIALGAILYSMGAPDPRLAVGLWMAAITSLIVTDFLDVVRLPRIVGSVLMWCVLIIYVLQFLLSWDSRMPVGHSTDWQLQSVVNVLIFLQLILLFQEKDARAYGWLLVMSLLQVIVAARYSRGVAFGSLLVSYAILGIFALSLLALFGHRKGAGLVSRDERAGRRYKVALPLPGPLPEKDVGRWPLAGMEPDIAGTPPGGSRAGIVPEYFARLSLIVAGGLVLAAVIFYAAPRPRIPYMRWGDTRKPVSVVGFKDKIELGALGETLESREEVMRVRFLDEATNNPYPLHTQEIYLRGTAVNWYSKNKWGRLPPDAYQEDGSLRGDIREEPLDYVIKVPEKEKDAALQIGPRVIQQTTLEPYLNQFDLFFIWPIVERDGSLHYEPQSERLNRRHPFSYELPTREFTFEVVTTGLADGIQPELVPARFKVRSAPLLQRPTAKEGRTLSRLTALSAQWLRDSGLSPSQHKEIAEYFERQLSSSGEFHYSLQSVERDGSIDAVEDFVSNNPSGHCEYFATALALMLRSQGIPSRVILGYRCDEYDPKTRVFQVRQLHAHAWVEAFLDPSKIPPSLRRENPNRWTYGGWLRLDATPAAELGSAAANSTAWGAWQTRWHALQHYWERYIADMDRAKQEESIYTPIRQFTSRLFSWEAWKELFIGAWHALARLLQSGIIGKLVAALLLVAATAMLVLVVRRAARLAIWLWRRLIVRGRPRTSATRTSVEFYHRFEQVVAQRGLFRRTGQTPREFAQSAGARLAKLSGQPQLCECAAQVAEAFYRVRFGRQELDAAAAEAVKMALEELKAGAATPRPQ